MAILAMFGFFALFAMVLIYSINSFLAYKEGWEDIEERRSKSRHLAMAILILSVLFIPSFGYVMNSLLDVRISIGDSKEFLMLESMFHVLYFVIPAMLAFPLYCFFNSIIWKHIVDAFRGE